MLESQASPVPRRPHRRHSFLFGRLATVEQHHDAPTNATSSSDVGSFWHLTDWHVNEWQPPNPNPCDMCRSSMTASSRCEQAPAGPFGHQQCDPAPSFWREALALMVRLAPSPDFILAGGDWIGHVPPRREGAAAVRSAALLLASLLHANYPDVPVVHALGNHDTHPYYSRAPAWRDWEQAWRSDSALGEAYVQRHLPNAEALGTFRTGGYYVRQLWPRPQQHPAPGLESGPRDVATEGGGAARTIWGISLNTNELALGGGAEQLRWLGKTLTAVRSRADSAILLGHIPPGPSHFELDSICAPGHYYSRAGGACWEARAQRRLVHLLSSFADVLPASYWGHHHTESVRIVAEEQRGHARARRGGAGGDGDAHAQHVMFLSPSLTPRNPPHDPTLRLYHYSRSTGRPLDFSEWRLDVTGANARGRAEWVRAPSALHTPPLNLSSMSAEAWGDSLRAMLAYDHRPASTEELLPLDPFLAWVGRERCAREAYVDSGRKEVPPLRKCKLAHLCAALHLADGPYSECIGQPVA